MLASGMCCFYYNQVPKITMFMSTSITNYNHDHKDYYVSTRAEGTEGKSGRACLLREPAAPIHMTTTPSRMTPR